MAGQSAGAVRVGGAPERSVRREWRGSGEVPGGRGVQSPPSSEVRRCGYWRWRTSSKNGSEA